MIAMQSKSQFLNRLSADNSIGIDSYLVGRSLSGFESFNGKEQLTFRCHFVGHFWISDRGLTCSMSESNWREKLAVTLPGTGKQATFSQ